MPYYRCAACGLTSYSAPAHVTVSVCANCSAALGDATPLDMAPGRGLTTRRALVARPQAAAEARREVIGLPLPEEARDRLSLLVSELVSNAVRHADAGPGHPVSLEIALRSGRARVAVRDGGQGFDKPSFDRLEPLDVGGLGLVIVDALSDSWGVEHDADGFTVWFEAIVERPNLAVEDKIAVAYVRGLAAEVVRAAAAPSA